MFNALKTNNEKERSGRSLRSSKVIDICFKNLSYSVQLSKDVTERRKILNDISGVCPGGQITAILGSSGAGKTSLLNVLACRITNTQLTKLEGNLTANGQPYDYSKFYSFSSYVMQNDILMETLTVREAFQFKWVEGELIKSMKLEKCQNAFIGGPMIKGISGGERKRTFIGVELVANPSCLLLDEPTSGLDSFTAFYIINQLQQLAYGQDRTIIFTIHQPSSDIYLMFDRIMLLVKGKLIFQGPRENIIDYFTSIGFKCPFFSNPLDYYLSIMQDNQTNSINFPIFFENYSKKIQPQVDIDIANQSSQVIDIKLVETSTLYQIFVIAQRDFINFKRNDMQMKGRIFGAIFLGLLFGGVFYGVGENSGSNSDLFSVAGCLFFVCLNAMFVAVLQFVLGFTIERDVFLREENSKLYSILSYFLGKQLIDIPFCIICPAIQSMIAYFMMALNTKTPDLVPIHALIFIILFLCSNSLGLFIGCLFTDTTLAINATNMFLIPPIIFSGFIANQKQFFSWIGWFQYLSPLKYAWEAIMLNETQSRDYDDDPAEIYDFKIGVWPCVGILIGFFIILRCLAYTINQFLFFKIQIVLSIYLSAISLSYKFILNLYQIILLKYSQYIYDYNRQFQKLVIIFIYHNLSELQEKSNSSSQFLIQPSFWKPLIMFIAQIAPQEKPTREVQERSGRSLRSSKVIDICFKNLKYSIPLNDGRESKTILNDITGICPGGQITAILGASGAGKTSLLNVLACRITNTPLTKLEGTLTANGQPYDYSQFYSFSSYVMQNDILMQTLTVREAFQFVANLKYSDQEMSRRRVDETIKSMKLDKCQHTYIGGPLIKGISGGEKKRTSIGVELVSNPSCLILDEPTSGLDSFTAFYIINQLKQLAKTQDRTIIFTIHQPSSDIYLMFDRIMLLVKGKLIYQGPRENILNYFTSTGFECPAFSNPLDYYLSIMHEDQNNQINYPIFFENYQKQIQPQVDMDIANQSQQKIEIKIVETSTLYQIQVIAQREITNFTRNDMHMKGRILTAIFLGLLFGGVFYGVGDNSGSRADLFSLAGCLFFVGLNAMFVGVLQYVLGFTVERDVFLREENSKLYTTFSYFIGKQFVDLPFCIISPALQSLIAYGMMALNGTEAKIVPIHALISILLFLSANSLGLLISCLFTDTTLAINATSMFLMPMIIFSGYIANQKQFYSWIGWFQYLSPLKYAWEAIVLNETEGRHYEIDPVDLYDFKIGVWPCIGILFGIFIIYRTLAYTFLYKLRTKLQ